MKKVTLELTNAEYDTIDNIEGSIGIWNILIMGSIVSENQFKVLDVDKFRKFLNDEIKSTTKKKEIRMNAYVPMKSGHLYNIKINKIKSILSKLDKAVKDTKEYSIEYRLSNGDVCERMFSGVNKTDAIRNYNHQTGCPRSAILSVTEYIEEEPKQIGKNKCCTEDNMEFVDMPVAMECEEYRCSKCDQMYTIRIEVERFWDDIETGSYWETL